jgi:excinuclease ABC subunit B
VLAAQLYHELTGLFPHNRVEYFVSYYDYFRPESYNSAADLYLDKLSQVRESLLGIDTAPREVAFGAAV